MNHTIPAGHPLLWLFSGIILGSAILGLFYVFSYDILKTEINGCLINKTNFQCNELSLRANLSKNASFEEVFDDDGWKGCCSTINKKKECINWR